MQYISWKYPNQPGFLFYLFNFFIFFFYKTAINVISHESYLQDFLSVYVLCYRTSKWDWNNTCLMISFVLHIWRKSCRRRWEIERGVRVIPERPETARSRSLFIMEQSSAQLRLLSAPSAVHAKNELHAQACPPCLNGSHRIIVPQLGAHSIASLLCRTRGCV